MSPAFATPVTTVTTEKDEVVTGQAAENKGCHDRHDWHERNVVEKGQKEKSLKGLAERLRQRREKSGPVVGISFREELTDPSQHFFSEPQTVLAVVPVVTVVTAREISDLKDFQGRDSGRDTPPVSRDTPLPDAGFGADDWGLTPSDRAEALSRTKSGTDGPASNEEAEEAERLLRVEAGLAFERGEGEGVGNIPHHVMVAGLLAASRMRPRLVIEAPLIMAHPWTLGIARLQTMAPLVGFSPQQWRQVQQGCAALLASHGPEMTRLDWTTEDGFGIHPEVGGNAGHCFGLGLLLGDGRVIEMTEAGARIKFCGGVQQSFTRRPDHWGVPVWTAVCRA